MGSGLFTVPKNSMRRGAWPGSALGVVAAVPNLTRNVEDVFGQAIASGVIVAVMVAKGFDIPLGDVGDNPAAGHAFLSGGKIAFLLVAAYASVALILTSRTVVRTPRGDNAA